MFKQLPIEQLPIAVIFTEFNYINIPFGYLHQLAEVGISTIYILLDDAQYQKAHNTQVQLFDHTEPATILKHYQSLSNRLNFHVINTGELNTEKEKLHYYLKNVAEQQYLINLFICQESIPALVSEDLTATFLQETVTQYFGLSFFETKSRELPSLNKASSSKEAIELLQRGQNPCLCYQMNQCDVLHYQWLFRIFVELLTIQIISNPRDDTAKAKVLVEKLIQTYDQSITALEKAEDSSMKRIQKSIGKEQLLGSGYNRNIQKLLNNRKHCLEAFPQIIIQLIGHYRGLISVEDMYDDIDVGCVSSHIFNIWKS